MDKFEHLYNLKTPVIFDRLGQFAYIPINKIAQTSINRHLLKDRVIVKKNNPKEWLNSANKYLNEDSWSKLITFAICRDPIEKFISAYFYLCRVNKINGCTDINAFVEKNLHKNIDIENIDIHFQKQSSAFYFNKKLISKHLVRLENINRDFPKVLSSFGVKSNIPIKNSSKIKTYNTILNKKSLKLVEFIYQDDIKILNYENWSTKIHNI